MATKSERRVSLIRWSDKVSIMLSWKEKGEHEQDVTKDKFIRFPNNTITSFVEQAVNKLVDKWVHVFLSEYDVNFVSGDLDEKAEMFDMLADSDHPVSDFLALK